jgi:hypothetical protein
MNKIQKSATTLALILFSASIISAQDLSKYRSFSLGASVASISNQVNASPEEISVIHQTPAVIQELTWWPVPSYQSSAPVDPVQDILFCFYNGELYKIVATYDSAATQGLTAEDMVQGIAAKYGVATLRVAETTPPTIAAYSNTDETIASWENARYSLTLSRSALAKTYQLVMFSRQLNGQAEAAIAVAAKQQRENAPHMEIARAKKEADDLEAIRLANLKAFRP